MKTKLPFGIDQADLDEINSLSVEELESRVLSIQFSLKEAEDFKESPEFIAAQEEFDYAKERYNLVAGPVKDTIKACRNKTKAVLARLEEKGKL
jgi:hypothetical protein